MNGSRSKSVFGSVPKSSLPQRANLAATRALQLGFEARGKAFRENARLTMEVNRADEAVPGIEKGAAARLKKFHAAHRQLRNPISKPPGQGRSVARLLKPRFELAWVSGLGGVAEPFFGLVGADAEGLGGYPVDDSAAGWVGCWYYSNADQTIWARAVPNSALNVWAGVFLGWTEAHAHLGMFAYEYSDEQRTWYSAAPGKAATAGPLVGGEGDYDGVPLPQILTLQIQARRNTWYALWAGLEAWVAGGGFIAVAGANGLAVVDKIEARPG